MGVTDPTDDDQIEMFINKLNQSISNQIQEEPDEEEPNEDSEIQKAIQRDLQLLEEGNFGKLSPRKPTPRTFEDEEDKKMSDEKEPSEADFNEYSLHNELNAMAQNINDAIDRETPAKSDIEDHDELNSRKDAKFESKEELEATSKVKFILEKGELEQKAEIIEESDNLSVSKKTSSLPKASPQREDLNNTSFELSKKFQLESEQASKLDIESSPKIPLATQTKADFMEFLSKIEEATQQELSSRPSSSKKPQSKSKIALDLMIEKDLNSPPQSNLKSQVVALETEVQECYTTINLLKSQKQRILESHEKEKKEWEANTKSIVEEQKKEYVEKIERHLGFIDQLVAEKKHLSETLEELRNDKVDCDAIMKKREKELQERFEIELKKKKELWMASEKLRREKWMKEETIKIKDTTIKALEPQMELMIRNHKKNLKQAKEQYIDELNNEKLKFAEEYEEKFNDFKAKNLREKEDAIENERERYEHKLQQQYERIEAQFNKERDRWNDNMRQETDRVESFRKRDLELHKDEINGIKKQHQEEMLSLKRFYEEKTEKLENSHNEELANLSAKLKEEYTEWREDFLQKQKEELREKLKEMRDQVKRERNEEINVIVNKLSSEAFDTEKALIAKFDRKEKELEAKYRNEILELKDRVETFRGKSDVERRTKEMLEENLSITSQRLSDNEAEISQKNIMIESLRSSIKSLTDQLNSLQASEEKQRANLEKEESIKREHLKAEISYLKQELQSTRLRLENESKTEMEIIQEKVKKAMNAKDETIRNLKEEIQTRETQIYKYKELLQKQRSQLLE